MAAERVSFLCAALLVASCASERRAATPPPAPTPAYAAQPAPIPDLGLRVTFIPWPVARAATDATLGPALIDILSHVPPTDNLPYTNRVTLAHEATHSVDNAIRGATFRSAVINGFYVMNGWGVTASEPRARKSQVAAIVPPSLRSGRYVHYLLGAPGWESRSLYVWEEWTAYTNGAVVAIDRYTRGLDRFDAGVRDDTIFAVLEMTVFALVTGMAIAINDPVSFASDPQLRAFLAWQTQRAMAAFRVGIVLPPYQWHETDGFYAALRSSPDAEPFRQFLRATYGSAWTYAVLGL